VAAKLTLYSQPGCCLCDMAKAALLSVQPRYGFDLVEIDISTDPALKQRYGHEIPVGVMDGRVVFRYRVSRTVIEKLFGETG
jgi:glutaredoxin